MAKLSDKVLSIILGGGQGTRLFPLTKERSKPAVPLGGKYRLVDIPISNCINSDLRRIYLLTQFNSASLHRHISQSYKFDHFSGGFVEILAAEQTFTDTSWYQGTADAVRKNLIHFLDHPAEYILILSGDQLYRMDFEPLIQEHVTNQADVTIATIPVPRKDASALGIMQIDSSGKIVRFEEKPKDPAVLDQLKVGPDSNVDLSSVGEGDHFLASMGIYLFSREMLTELLDNTMTDFGKHIIPGAIQSHSVFAHVFQGYWEDVGTIRNYFEACLDFASDRPKFDFFDMGAPIFTHARFLPASRCHGTRVDHAVISDGCLLNHCKISNSIVGIRSIVRKGSELNRVVMLGNDYFERESAKESNTAAGRPGIGVGEGTRIENAIIDKNARIGKNCVLRPDAHEGEVDTENYFIREGIVIVPKNAVIPDNTQI